MICLVAFAAFLDVNEKSLRRQSKQLAEESSFLLYEPRMGESRAGKYGLQRKVVSGFLDCVGSRHGLENPSGHVSMEKTPLLELPSDMTKLCVYHKYLDVYMDIITAVSGSTSPEHCPLSFSALTNIGRKITHIYKL